MPTFGVTLPGAMSALKQIIVPFRMTHFCTWAFHFRCASENSVRFEHTLVALTASKQAANASPTQHTYQHSLQKLQLKTLSLTFTHLTHPPHPPVRPCPRSPNEDAALDGLLGPFNWSSFYRPIHGTAVDYMRKHPALFLERPDGAFHRLPMPMLPPPGMAAPWRPPFSDKFPGALRWVAARPTAAVMQRRW